MRPRIHAQIAALAVATLVALALPWVGAQQRGTVSVAIDSNDIGGTVVSAKGPEAGAWVIAETSQLPTKFVRIVVTDDRGRYVLPDLPSATYQVFVRGYGLIDSSRQSGKPGQQLNLQASAAADARAAAQVYPAAWWLSMISLPSDAQAQREFVLNAKQCLDCHQVGNKATREMRPEVVAASSSTLDAWMRRTRVGPSGPQMSADFMRFGDHRQLLADWSDRVAKGDAPRVAPPRPAGIERNVVVTLWDWGTPLDGRSDNAASDLRDPRVNANGPIFGVSQSTDTLNVLYPQENAAVVVKVPSRAQPLVSAFSAAANPSPYYGSDIWKRAADPRSVAIDREGRVWFAARNREASQQPAFCGPGANRFGQNFPLRQSGRQVAIYDPKTKQFGDIDTCFTADHNQISRDDVIYFGQSNAIGWIDMNAWDKTKDSEASQGWCPAVLDTNGDGKITEWTEPDQPVDPRKDHRIAFGCYSATVNPKDGSVWCSGIGRGDKTLVRLEKGPNPPMTCKAEVYEPPPSPTHEVFGSGGVEADDSGIVWQNWRVSGDFSAFDRSKCKVTNGPTATGQSCPEGWTFHRKDDPTYGNSTFKTTESYLTHLDFHDVLGLGKDAPMYGSVNTDSIDVLSPRTKQFVTLRVPYPMGFFTRSATGRIDDPSAGWKGKGLFASYSNYAPWHEEGGKGTLTKVVKFQIRPDPLAK